jgi:hypothetical protein
LVSSETEHTPTLFDTARDESAARPLPAHSAPVPKLFITESRAGQLFVEAAALHRPGAVRNASVSFHPFRATLYTFKINRAGVAHVKFHVAFRRAPEIVLTQACAVMICRSRGRKAFQRAEYDAFVRNLAPTDFELPGARKSRQLALSTPGKFHSLDESFDRVNETYFQSQLSKPQLCWSPVHARRLLGSYHERKDRLIISQVFDSPKIPAYVLDYLMYHELLHKFLGIGRRDDGRRCVHGREFREIEKRYAYFAEAQAFLKKKL